MIKKIYNRRFYFTKCTWLTENTTKSIWNKNAK